MEVLVLFDGATVESVATCCSLLLLDHELPLECFLLSCRFEPFGQLTLLDVAGLKRLNDCIGLLIRGYPTGFGHREVIDGRLSIAEMLDRRDEDGLSSVWTTGYLRKFEFGHSITGFLAAGYDRSLIGILVDIQRFAARRPSHGNCTTG